jgi:hypothetical protein
LEINFSFLHQNPQKTVLKAGCIPIVNLSDRSKLQEIHHDILDRYFTADNHYAYCLSGDSNPELHNCHDKLIKAKFAIVHPYQRKLHHLYRLIDFPFNLHV